MTFYLYGKNNLNDSRLLMKDEGGQKEVPQYFFKC